MSLFFCIEALNVTKEMLMKQTVPSQKVLRFLLLKLGAAGDVANINFIGDHLTETLKQAIKFNNLRANAYVSR